MKKLLPFLLAVFLPLTSQAQHQAVTLLPNGLGAGTLNTAGISYYSMGPFTYDFTGSTLLNAGLVATGTTITQTITQANSFVAGQPVTINSSGVWVGASANSTIALANALGVVSSTNLSGTQFTVVLNGVCVVNGGSFTVGAIYYVPLSAGIVTSTAPSSTGQYVYPLATAVSAGVLWVSTSTPSVVTNSLGSSGAYTLLANNTNATAPAAALQNSIILGTPSITDTGIGIQETNSVTGYFQNLIQNTSNNAAASADTVVANNLATGSNYYGDFGINSSSFTGTGSFNLANAVYLYAIPGDLVLGTWNTSGTTRIVAASNTGTSSADIADFVVSGEALSGMLSIGNNTTVTGYQLELHGSTPIVANGGAGIQVNTQLTAAATNTYNFLNFTPTFNTSTYTGNSLNSINIGTATVSTTGGGTLTGGYQINVAAPAAGQAGALNIASGAVNLGSGAITSSGSVVLNSATGGSQGAGTINATGLYVNGAAVSSPLASNNTWTGTNTFNNTVSGTGITSLFASPPAIGGTAAAAGSFTTLSASSTVSGTGFSTYLASPPAIGGTAAAAGSFTTLSASSTVSGTGFSTYLASPPAIGGTAAAAGSFTTLAASSTLNVTGTSTLTGNVTFGGNLTSAGSLTFQTNGTTTALTMDASQNATFAGKVTSSKASISGYSSLTESANAVTIDWSLANTFALTLNGNLNTVTFSNAASGETIVVAITNTASNYTVTWGNSIKWVGASQPVQTIGAHTDVWTIIDVNGTYYGSVVQNF